MKSHRDLFDPLLDFPFFRLFKKFYFKYKDGLLYLFWGFVNFVIGYLAFFAFYYGLGINELITNALGWVVSVVSGFFLFGIFVFESHEGNTKKEFFKFVSGRISSLVIGEIIVLILSNGFGVPAYITKFINDFVTTVLNYFISKFFVFK